MKQDFIEDNLIILSKQTIDLFLKEENPSDLLALYCFYYYTAKWQKTNQPKATTLFVSNGLKWSPAKVKRNKKQLIKLDLIEDIREIDEKTKRVKGWYIKIKYIWKQTNLNSHPVENPPSGKTHPVVKIATNALSANSINSLNANILGLGKLNRKEVSFKKEDYNELLKQYQLLKGITLQGREFLPVQQTLKTMFLSKRTPEQIIKCMKWFAEKSSLEDKNYYWTRSWTINTIAIKLPEYLAGKFNESKSCDIEIPSYARGYIK